MRIISLNWDEFFRVWDWDLKTGFNTVNLLIKDGVKNFHLFQVTLSPQMFNYCYNLQDIFLPQKVSGLGLFI